MKKIIFYLLAIVMIFSFVGCSEKNEATGTPETSANTDVSESAPPEEIYNVVMEIVNFGYDDQDIGMVEDAINEISEEKIGVHVTLLTVPIFNMGTKLELMVAGNEQMDIVQTGLLTTPNRLVSSGLLLPMTEYLTDDMISLAGDLLKASTINGEVYAYPANLYPGTAVSLIYDKDLAEEYGIDMPEKISTIEQFEEVFEQVAASGMTQYALSAGDGVNAEWVFGADLENLGDLTYYSYGVVLGTSEDDEIVNWYETETYKKQCETKRSWFEKGYLLPDSISNGYTVIDSMKQGTIFSYITPIGTGTSAAYWSAQTGKNLDTVPISDVIITASGTINLSYGIAANCENPQKAVEFLDLLYTDSDVANLLSNGIEGVHYTTQEGSKIIKYPEGVDPTTVGYGSFIGPIGNGKILYFREPFDDDFVNNIGDYGLENAKVSKYLGFTFDTEPVQTELAAVNAVIAQYGPSLACGIVDPADILPEYISALKEAGIDTVIAESQAQLNTWLEENK